ncbi:hypothetical protein HCDG_04198 [Histoplasma capsulatum H143]|uniref:Uncharacterized protein n=1 Tax=Ajellomyces capsulatus (strain H143) TaxID=544712 RepID=C6HDB7_AJECH|nr:hypothetical protein HCDG_04198 [Histoplasma capsulatum H143]
MAERVMPKSQKTQLRESAYLSLPSKCSLKDTVLVYRSKTRG